MENQTALIATMTMEVEIEASPKAVWEALTDDIGQWWPADFYAGGEAGSRDFRLEARPGGRMYEEWGSGGGVLWGTVVTADPRKCLQVIGHLFPEWGGPSEWYGSWTLKPTAGGTTLQFSESAIGRVTAESTAKKDEGWRFLWSALKAHVEG
ncbi:MAG: SRPBCC domain-containing protein [Pseudomonadota bacterium]